MRAESTNESPRWRGITFIANPVLSIVSSVLLTIALRLFIERTWPYLTAFWNVWWLRTIGTLVVGGIGVGLFLFRKHYQTLYGMSEVTFAVIVIWISLGKLQIAPDAASWIAVVAAAYLIVRGLTNCDEGKRKRVA